ncbi:molybdopterin molybdotransferase MoeA [Candidatus Bathyarchaeota archaeon]|nr:molybdopterin molybdotransferase MoeA [Candidatus Bathyarchaeota archaeon]
MSGFRSLSTVDEALKRLLEAIKDHKLSVEEVSLENSVDRICGEDLLAPVDIPPFNRSAVDGYAVRYIDVLSASPSNPIELKIVGVSEADYDLGTLPKVNPGEAVEIYTGAPIPFGADSVIMAEFCKRDGDKLWVSKPVAYMQNISVKGEDFKTGDLVVAKGVKLKPWHVGALASLGIVSVTVYRKPVVLIASTGLELKQLGSEDHSGKIYDSTRPMLKALLKNINCTVLDFGILPDEPTYTMKTISKHLESVDLVIITGGTSLGLRDATPEALNMLEGSKLIFHGVRMRPGKPTGAYLVKDRIIFMLSGFPVAAFIGFKVFVEPAIYALTGSKPDPQPTVKAYVTRRLAKPTGVKAYIRVRVYRSQNRFYAEPLRLTGSGILSTLTRGNGILVLEEEVEGLEEGEEVEVLLTQPFEEVE